MTEKRRRYTKVDRAKALGIAIVKGQAAAADETGIPLSTLNQWWLDPKYGYLRNTTREDIIEQFRLAMQVGIEEVRKGLESDAPLRDKAVAASMLAEKYALFRGEATTRTETRDITGSLSDEDLEAVTTSIDEWLKERKAEDALPDA